MKPLTDKVETNEAVKILLVKKGKIKAGVCIEGEEEVRSRSLTRKQNVDDSKKN